jgi:hypothetical protein
VDKAKYSWRCFLAHIIVGCRPLIRPLLRRRLVLDAQSPQPAISNLKPEISDFKFAISNRIPNPKRPKSKIQNPKWK